MYQECLKELFEQVYEFIGILKWKTIGCLLYGVIVLQTNRIKAISVILFGGKRDKDYNDHSDDYKSFKLLKIQSDGRTTCNGKIVQCSFPASW